jgi:antirestriction protein
METNNWSIVKDDTRFLVVGFDDCDFELDTYEEAASFLDFMNEDETRKEDPDFYFDEWSYITFEASSAAFDEQEKNEVESEEDFDAELGEVLSYLGVVTA